jgi:hypothetical protein
MFKMSSVKGDSSVCDNLPIIVDDQGSSMGVNKGEVEEQAANTLLTMSNVEGDVEINNDGEQMTSTAPPLLLYVGNNDVAGHQMEGSSPATGEESSVQPNINMKINHPVKSGFIAPILQENFHGESLFSWFTKNSSLLGPGTLAVKGHFI